MCQCVLNIVILVHGYEQDKAVLPILHTSLALLRQTCNTKKLIALRIGNTENSQKSR